MTHRGPFQPLTFCDSVKRKKNHTHPKPNPQQQQKNLKKRSTILTYMPLAWGSEGQQRDPEEKIVQRCGKGITGTIKWILSHPGDHKVHGQSGPCKTWSSFCLGLALPKSLTEHPIWLTFQAYMSLKELIVSRANEGELWCQQKWHFYWKQAWKHPTVLDRFGICVMAKNNHIKMLLTRIILERDFPAIFLNSAFIRFKSTSLRETITLIRVPSWVPAPWNNRS